MEKFSKSAVDTREFLQIEKHPEKIDGKAGTIVCIVGMLMPIWTIYTGYKLATERRSYHLDQYSSLGVIFGVATAVLGSIYFIIGVHEVAQMGSDFLEFAQENDIETGIEQANDRKVICQVLVQISEAAASSMMLIWAIYNAVNLVIEPQKDYNHLAFFIGVIAISFGFVYFIIGAAIIANFALNLSAHMHSQLRDSDHQFPKIRENLVVQIFFSRKKYLK